MERDSDHGYEQEIELIMKLGLKGQNCTWDRILEKANNEKNMLRHMAKHYWVRNDMCKARIKILKAKLKKASNRRKRQDRLQILDKDSLAQNST